MPILVWLDRFHSMHNSTRLMTYDQRQVLMIMITLKLEILDRAYVSAIRAFAANELITLAGAPIHRALTTSRTHIIEYIVGAEHPSSIIPQVITPEQFRFVGYFRK